MKVLVRAFPKRLSLLKILAIILLITQITSFSPRSFHGSYQKRSNLQLNNAELDNSDFYDIWSFRRKVTRKVLSPLVDPYLKQEKLKKEDENKAEKEKKENELASTTVGATFILAIFAVALRFGGRGAFIQLLGLDFIADSGVKEQISSFLTFFNGLEGFQYFYFFLAWLVAKLVCIDALTIVLAFSSGILFGGVVEGTTISVLCSSLASLIIFLSTRYLFQTSAQEQLEKRPVLKAIDRACSKDGLKTVFTLRVSPLLPIPIGAYNFLYALTSVTAVEFLLGITAGSIKPYLLDSYLGIFGKSILDDPQGLNSAFGAKDIALLGVVALLILIGTFATQIATNTWNEIQSEMKSISGEDDKNNPNDVDWFQMFGVSPEDLPVWVNGLKKDSDAAWNRLESVMLDEWDQLKIKRPEIQKEKGNS